MEIAVLRRSELLKQLDQLAFCPNIAVFALLPAERKNLRDDPTLKALGTLVLELERFDDENFRLTHDLGGIHIDFSILHLH